MSTPEKITVPQVLAAYAREYARLSDTDRELLTDSLAATLVPVSEYAQTVDAQGDWQSRARRVINAANALMDAVEDPPLGSSRFREIDKGLIGLRMALTNTDFREETP